MNYYLPDKVAGIYKPYLIYFIMSEKEYVLTGIDNSELFKK